MFNVVVSAVLAYAITSGYMGNRLLSLYEILNTKDIAIFLVMAFFLVLFALLLLDHWKHNRRQIRAALSMRKHPKLRKHILDGVTDGSFAYLISPQPYGADAMLPPMTVVFVSSVEDRGEKRIAYVVPKFESQVDMDKSVLTSVPQMHIEVPYDQLWKYVPRHMIPELV